MLSEKNVVSCSGLQLTALNYWFPDFIDAEEFTCSCNNLNNLKGSPSILTGNFDCSLNKLKTLEGGPSFVNGCYNCDYNKLKNLKGSPKVVNSDFYCAYNDLKTLEGCPLEIWGCVHCDFNKHLKDIRHLPPMVRNIFIDGCNDLTIFTKNVETELTFRYCSNKVKQRIKSWPYYKVMYETPFSITVVRKFFVDELEKLIILL